MSLDQWGSLTPEQQNDLLNGPALQPPDGIASNFENPPNHNGVVLGIAVPFTILAFIFVSIRIYVKMFVTKKVRVEDGIALLALGPYIGTLWVVYGTYSLNGIFVHQWDIRLRDFLFIIYHITLLPLFYAFFMLFAKTAILLEWLHIFAPGGQRNIIYWTCWPVLALNVAFYLAGIFVIVFTCSPPEKFWHILTPGTCFNRRAFDFSSSIINLSFDLVILLIPQRVIWKLNMNLRRKISVSLIFSVGVLNLRKRLLSERRACVAAGGRIVVGIALVSSKDRSFDASAPALFVVVEETCVLLVFSATAAPKVFEQNGIIAQIARRLKSLYCNRTLAGVSETELTERHSPRNERPYGGLNIESGMQFVKLPSSDSFKRTPSTANQYAHDNANHSGMNVILKTTTLTTQPDVSSVPYDSYRLTQQHPWMGDINNNEQLNPNSLT
ncbi:hypothetical protein O1611_g3201 [Lasiodiplodia mahajangana]|uniref:Uncharacterized protein n=1 Tax=Lasiodiplodia mahajangana TaxID=1108764 RepID=A0ACC2JSW1_9PEZI|nr:hypothetical protein O1611_g3201 [Lasiodiplodia mahajangana]